MNELVEGRPIGILRGASARGAGMDIVAPYLEDPPSQGDFAVVPGAGGALVLRIAGAYPAGSFAEASERGADYLAQLARWSQGEPGSDAVEVPGRVRDLLLRFRVEVVPLGSLKVDGDAWRFEPGVRAIQLFGRPAWRPSRRLLEFLVNVGLEGEDPAQVVRIGTLARGHETTDIPVRFSVRRLKGRRTFVFARAGYGKSNLTKLLLSRIYEAPPDVGLLIVDPEGEYAFSQRSEKGTLIPGLVDHPNLCDRVRVFSDRRPSPGTVNASRIVGSIKLDVSAMSPDEFLSAFVPEEKREQVWANFIRSAGGSGWADVVRLLREKGYSVTDAELGVALRVRLQGKGDGNVSLQAIRNNLVPVLQRVDDPKSRLLDVCTKHLFGHGDNPPGVVVLDVSTVAMRDADAVVRVVMHQLFQRSVEDFTRGAARTRGVLLVLEEAQSVLGARGLDDQDIYVRWVKEGRKYGLGAMLITQQPGAVAPELVSQGDNFFVMHLLAQRDLLVLGAANAHFTPEVLEFVRSEPVKGNCYFWSAPDQPYVVGTRVDDYEQRDGVRASAPPDPPPPPDPQTYPERLADGVLRALLTVPRVFLYRVSRLDGRPVQRCLAVAADYLAVNVANAAELQEDRPDDWSLRQGGRPVLLDAALHEALTRLGLAWKPPRATGPVEDRERQMVLLDELALRELAVGLGEKMKAIRGEALELLTAPLHP